ncbi:hypothetical protein BDZ89DRAFT_1061627 [Hymenopellis radicata]|nr:hypothetical protein BDZ89DRAFT_1061627 [Hymenopellis radicata]
MTTTATMLEPFDTQMFDYQPDDVEMNPSHEIWSHQMDTDVHFSSEKFAENDNIEIDMDAYPQDQEYEMSEPDADYSGEMVDVEELDTTAPSEPQSAFLEVPPAMEYPSHSVSSLPITPTQPPVTELVAPEVHDFTGIAEPHGAFIQLEVYEEAQVIPEVDIVDAPVEEPVTLDQLEAEVPYDAPESFDATAAESDQPFDGGDVAAPEVVAEASEESSLPHAAAETAEDQQQSSEVKDPHEISDGVFIEPPPGILLSFPDVDHEDACLFNQPNVPSSSSTEHHEFTVLLQENPTLYYEPLTDVFEALRQDEHFSSIADLSASELVLDAYDLQLVVSEDNVHARVVSLHDLSLVYNASGSSGPLRLKLRTISPRFIIRYRHLHEEVSRLQFGGEEYTEPANDQQYDANGEQVFESDILHAAEIQQEEETAEPSYSHEEEQEQTEQEEAQQGDAAHSNFDRALGADDATAEHTYNEEEVQDGNDASYGSKPTEVEEQAVQEPTSVAPAEQTSAELVIEETSLEDSEHDAEEASTVPSVFVTPRAPDSALPASDLSTLDVPPPPEDDDDDFDDLGNEPELRGPITETDDTAENAEELEFFEESEHGPAIDEDNTKDTEEYSEENEAQNEDVDFEGSLEHYGDDDWEAETAEHNEEHGGDTTWDEIDPETASNESSATLGSKSSKRSIDEVEYDASEYDEPGVLSGSPGSKRARVEV